MDYRRRAPFRLIAVLGALWVKTSVAAPTLTMDEAVSRALARSPELAASHEAERAADSRIGQARTSYWPRLSLEASYGAHWPKNTLPIDLSGLAGLSKIGQVIPGLDIRPPQISEIDDYHRVRAGGGVSMRLLDFSRGARVDAAQSSLAAEQARTREAAASLAFQTRAAFLAALFARDLRRIAGESLDLALAEEKRARLRAEVGTGSQLALAQSRVRVAGLRAQLRQAESELDRQRRQLASLLGIEVSGLLELQGELSALAGPLPADRLEQAPVVDRLRQTRQAAELSARSLDRTFWPTLSISARADYEYPHAFRLEWGPLLQGGVTLSWELFDAGLRQAQTAEARASARSLAEQGTATEQSLRRRLIDIEARTKIADANLLSARETLEQQEIYLRVAQAAVAAGTGTELDVHNAQLGLDRARVDVQQALLSKALARAEGLMIHGVAVESGPASSHQLPSLGGSGGAR